MNHSEKYLKFLCWASFVRVSIYYTFALRWCKTDFSKSVCLIGNFV